MLGTCFFAVPLITAFGGASPQGEAFLRFRYTGLPQKCAVFLWDRRKGARVKSASLSYVIPNGKSARQKTRALAREGSPRLLSLSGGFLAPLTSPRWGSCAASSKCSCKQAFLLASGGMTGEGAPPVLRPVGAHAPLCRNAPASGHSSSRLTE